VRVAFKRTKNFFRRIGRWLVGHKDPREVALGLAIGAAVSVTPLVGFHAVLALLIASVTPSNRLAALASTQLGNPLTLPFFFWLEIEIGGWITGRVVGASLDFTSLESVFESLGGFLGQAALPWMVGAGLLSVCVGLIVYYLTILVAKLLHLRMRRRLLREEAALLAGDADDDERDNDRAAE
jgi:uncharacterized protein